ncbi:MAG TPA: heavy metal translocating P-type ATPase [Microbacterium sp.]|uniref:heavy metal translocating P-type ATPase n=1 Tax=Microbacterium sp. TaxID=51671 RepID=UPI002B478032|nr:heavy metal translocating P-type ATPase [Microbacterium sp.]HKT56521.1 heavy metal translocating P-type ATPase [Microbacterium sp.]
MIQSRAADRRAIRPQPIEGARRTQAARLLWTRLVIVVTALVLAAALTLDAAGQHSFSRWATLVWVAAVVVWTVARMVRDVIRGHVGLDILAVMAMVATLAVGEDIAALIIVLMLSGGEALEEFAAHRAKRDLRALLDRSPRTAHVVLHPGDMHSEAVVDVPVEDVVIGDVLLVRPSEVVPVDGALLTGDASFDESSLTGESLPVERTAGDEVLSGSVNGERAVRIRAVRRSTDSQFQQIVALVHAAEQSRAPVVRLADRFAIPFTLVSVVLAGIAWMLSGDPVRLAEVLVLATPCPLLIAAPVAFLGGLSRAAKDGVIMKGGAVIEQLARVRVAAFDKTGTLTRGAPVLIEIRPERGFQADEVLRLAASAEQYSSHTLAAGIRQAAMDRGLILGRSEDAGEIATNGVTATVEGRAVAVGKPAYVAMLAPELRRVELAPGQAAAYVAVDKRFAGALVLADAPRPESAAVVSWLRDHGVERIVMLTGDARPTAESIGAVVGISEVQPELLPGEKVHLAAALRPRPLMMVGDGVNDAPVLAASDIGIAMGARGATAAGDAADVVILVDSLRPLVDAIAIGRRTVRIALTAIWIGITLSIGLMLVAMTGLIPAVAGALIQELVDLATILYALRALTSGRANPIPGFGSAVSGAGRGNALGRAAAADR